MFQARTIINADDFGWDKAASLAILKLAENNCISSTTVLANFVNTADLKSLISMDHISVGMHINLISGFPISEPSKIESLLNPDSGSFFSAKNLWMRYLSGKVSSLHIEVEIKNQYEYLLDHGCDVSHADSHQHIHIFPGLSVEIIKVLHKLNISKVRNCDIAEFYDSRRFLIKLFNFMSRSKPLVSTEGLISAFSIYKNIDLNLFERKVVPIMLKKGLTELMVHPAIDDRLDSYLQRKVEFDFLISGEWKELLEKYRIELVNWSKIGKTSYVVT